MMSGDTLELEQYRADEAAGLLLRLPVSLDTTAWRVRDDGWKLRQEMEE